MLASTSDQDEPHLCVMFYSSFSYHLYVLKKRKQSVISDLIRQKQVKVQ